MLLPLAPGVAGSGGTPPVAVSVAIGVLIGTLSGLLGVGGGVLLVPLLTLGVHVAQHEAQGASLAMVIPTAISGLVGYTKRGQVRWGLVPVLAPAAACRPRSAARRLPRRSTRIACSRCSGCW